MKKLIEGIIDFRHSSLEEYRNKFSKLAIQQTPDALFVACCDSRVVPNTFASSDPGDLFVLRNIGNLIPPCCSGSLCNQYTDASVAATLEFSLRSLKVKDIIICGHSECGAMQALIEHTSEAAEPNSSLAMWLKYASSSYIKFKNSPGEKTDLSACNLLSRINVLQQLDNLKTYPLVMEQLQCGQLKIHGWWFDLATANVFYYNQNSKKFILIDDNEAQRILSSTAY